MNKTQRRIRLVGTILCQVFALVSVAVLAVQGQDSGRIVLAAATLVLVLLPEVVERVFHCKLWTPVYVFSLVYAMGPMLGHAFNFYYLIPGWDKLLHISGGVLFAVVGACLYPALAGQPSPRPLATAVFALCFSMAISMAWEFFEFGSDQLLHTDMQNDTVITEIHSHRLDEEMGAVGHLEHITASAINGEIMAWNGYLDIGLLDTMWDMILETLGALAVALYLAFSQGKHPIVQPIVHNREREIPS